MSWVVAFRFLCLKFVVTLIKLIKSLSKQMKVMFSKLCNDNSLVNIPVF